nr:unnamed protein product [Spirometra erinaceieuropaei]
MSQWPETEDYINSLQNPSGGDHFIFFRLKEVEDDIYTSACLDFSCMLWCFLTKSSSSYCQRSSSVNGSSFVRIRSF